MANVLRPWLDGNIPASRGPGILLATGRADVEVAFIERVGEGSCRVYYPADTLNEVVAPLTEGIYSEGAVCPAVLGADGRVAMVYPPLVLGQDHLLVGDRAEREADRAAEIEETNRVLGEVRTQLSDEMLRVDQELLDRKQEILDAAGLAADAKDAADKAVTNNVVEYALSSSRTVEPVDGWTQSTVLPTEAKPYVWMHTIITYGSGSTVTTDAVVTTGPAGAPGVSVTGITSYWRTTTTDVAPAKPTVETPPGWSTTEPGYVAGTFLWRVEKASFSDGQFAYGPVSKVSAYVASTLAWTLASSKSKVTAGVDYPPDPDPGDLHYKQKVEGGETVVDALMLRNIAAWEAFKLWVDSIAAVNSIGAALIRADEALFEKLGTKELWAALATIDTLRVTNQMYGNAIEADSVASRWGNFGDLAVEGLSIQPTPVWTALFNGTFESSLQGATAYSSTGSTVTRSTAAKRSGSYGVRAAGDATVPQGVKFVGGQDFDVFSTYGMKVEAWVRSPVATTVEVGCAPEISANRPTITRSVSVAADVWTLVTLQVPWAGVVGWFWIVAPGPGVPYLDVDDVRFLEDTSTGQRAQLIGTDPSGKPILAAGGQIALLEDVVEAANRRPVLTGRRTITGSIAAGAALDVSVAVPGGTEGYRLIPTMYGGKGAVDRCAVSVTGYTPTAATVTVKNHTTGATSGALYIDWVAVPTA